MSKTQHLLDILVIVLLLTLISLLVFSFSLFFRSPQLSTVDLRTSSVTPTPAPSSTPTPNPTPTSTPIPTSIPLPSSKPTSPPPPALSGPPGSGLSTVTVSTPKGSFSVTVLSLDTASTQMFTDSAQDNDCSASCLTISLKDFITRNNGFAGVNGTYFCPASYPDCAGKTDSFDFPVYNSRLHKWMQGDKLGWTSRRAIFYTDGSGAHYQNDSSGFSGGLNAGIINYPGLVDGGNVQIDDNQSGLSDKQKSKGTKVGIGTRNPGNIMVVVAYNVNMQEFAHVFKSLGATGALNLDTGGSTALYFNGRYVLGPGRNLPNAIVFVRR